MFTSLHTWQALAGRKSKTLNPCALVKTAGPNSRMKQWLVGMALMKIFTWGDPHCTDDGPCVKAVDAGRRSPSSAVQSFKVDSMDRDEWFMSMLDTSRRVISDNVGRVASASQSHEGLFVARACPSIIFKSAGPSFVGVTSRRPGNCNRPSECVDHS
ncbi:hypothetical protein K439DRAFT_411389 [Ramaria rubella]|nr:hypothetical protein K439DRAFT_411389 [Ramaria rubella]